MDEVLEKSYSDSALYADLHKDQTVIFIYLAGIDTNGHRHNPGSDQYRANIRLVDQGDVCSHIRPMNDCVEICHLPLVLDLILCA